MSRPLSFVRAFVRADPARACLLLLVLVDLFIVWSLPVLTGQDLPQHLSYARILADYSDPRLPFQETFLLPEHAQPYFTAYLLLKVLARFTSVLTAGKLVYSAYVIAMAWGFSSLVRAVHGRDTTLPWTCLFGPLLVWNPIQCVGFLPFMLGLPAILFGAAAMVRASGKSSSRALFVVVVASAFAASLHFVAAACLMVFGVLHALCLPSRRRIVAASVAAASSLATVVLWRLLGDPGLAAFPKEELVEQISRIGVYDGIVRTLGVQWNTLEDKGAFVMATVLGPLPQLLKGVVAVAIVALVAVAWTSRTARPHPSGSPPRKSGRGEREREGATYFTLLPPCLRGGRPEGWGSRSTRTAYGLAVLAFAILTVVTPTAIRVPDDICLLDFRLYVILFMLALAFIDPRWFEPLRARVAVATFGTLVLLLWSRQLSGVAGEAQAVVRLVGRLTPADRLLALPFHDRSEYLDEANSVTHYFPVYHTALSGGVTSLFWGKFSHHLPVGYRPGREPAHPPDWGPAQFTRSELLSASHVIVEWPDSDDGDVQVAAADRLRDELAEGFSELGCDGRWCLYKSPLTLEEEARR